MKKKLSPKTIDALKPAKAKRYEVRDTLVAGLMVRVSNVGNNVCYLNRRIRIGSYSVVSLSDARQLAKDILTDISLGSLSQMMAFHATKN